MEMGKEKRGMSAFVADHPRQVWSGTGLALGDCLASLTPDKLHKVHVEVACRTLSSFAKDCDQTTL